MLTQKQVDQFNKFFTFKVEIMAHMEIKPKSNTNVYAFEPGEIAYYERFDNELCLLEVKNNKNGYVSRTFEEVRNPEQLLNDIVLLLSHVNDEDRAYEILEDEDSILSQLDY